MARRRTLPPTLPWMQPWLEVSFVLAEAQAIMAMRLWGLAGLWPVVAGESQRMVSEKAPAFAESAVAATVAAMALRPAPEVALASLKPIRKITRANHRRLTNGGRR